MEHRDDAPLADESRAGAIPNDQPLGAAAGPGEDAPAAPEDGDDEDRPPQSPPP